MFSFQDIGKRFTGFISLLALILESRKQKTKAQVQCNRHIQPKMPKTYSAGLIQQWLKRGLQGRSSIAHTDHLKS